MCLRKGDWVPSLNCDGEPGLTAGSECPPNPFKKRVDAIRDLVGGVGFLLFRSDDGIFRLKRLLELER